MGRTSDVDRFARVIVAHRWWVLVTWLLVAVLGGLGAPKAVGALSYDFGLPGQPGAETNQQIVERFGSGGGNAPVLLVVGDGSGRITDEVASQTEQAVAAATPGARVTSWLQTPDLLSRDGRTGVVVVYPRPVPGPEPYAAALPALQAVAAQMSQRSAVPVVATGTDALAAGGGGGGADVLAETLFGGIGALVVLVVVFGSFLAVTPLLVAAASILTTFLAVWGLT
jgi:putative drug exporter of the RND superfamily